MGDSKEKKKLERDGFLESNRESKETMAQWKIGGGSIIKLEKKKLEIKKKGGG